MKSHEPARNLVSVIRVISWIVIDALPACDKGRLAKNKQKFFLNLLQSASADDRAARAPNHSRKLTVGRNRGARLTFVVCSKAYAYLISFGSLYADPKKEMPNGNPKM